MRMKRKTVVIIAVALLTICLACVLCACDAKKGDELKSNVSRETSAFYAGESDLFAVTLEKGKRESVFIADGKATDVVEFTQITVTPLKSNDYEQIEYALACDAETLTGVVQKSDFGEFTATIELDFVPDKVTITAGDDTAEIQLSDILNGCLTSSDAINIAKEEFKDRLAQSSDEREIYVKLITGDRTNYYYYVSFIGEGVDYYAMLIDPHSGAVITKK